MMIANRLSSLPSFGPNGPSLALSRRDYRTQPAVLTPGADQRTFRPEGAVELVLPLYTELSRANHRSKISYAPSGRVVGWACSPGLKPRAESYYPFGICSTSPYWTVCPGPNTDANRLLPDQDRQSK
jgi:hypothetical protein